MRRGEPRLRGALLLGGAESFELAPQSGRGALGVGPGGRLVLEHLALFLHEAARLFGGPEVVTRERLDLGQSLAGAAPAGDRRGVDRNRLDAEHGGRRQGRAGPLGEHLVEEQLPRPARLGDEVGSRGRVRGRSGHPPHTSACRPVTLDHSPWDPSESSAQSEVRRSRASAS